ncbi:hypothetical protein LguiB_013456 [Lonicera macranthoides]
MIDHGQPMIDHGVLCLKANLHHDRSWNPMIDHASGKFLRSAFCELFTSA